MITKIRGQQLVDAFFGAGLKRNGSDADIMDVNVDDSTIEISSDALQIKALGISNSHIATDAAIAYSKLSLSNSILEADLAVSNAPTSGYFLKWNGTAMEWANVATGAVQDADLVANEIPAGSINGSNVTFTLAATPVSTSVQIYLNGLMQQPGASKDYELSGGTITFATAPETGDILLANYVKSA